MRCDCLYDDENILRFDFGISIICSDKGHSDVIIMISSRVSMISSRRLKCGTLYALSRQKNPILRKVRRSWALMEFYFSVNGGRNRDLLSSHDRVPWQPVRDQPSRLG